MICTCTHMIASPTMISATFNSLIKKVYCRLRPLKQDENESCAEVKPPSVLQLTPPECSIAYKSGHYNPVS